MLKYIHTVWKHDLNDEPIEILSELDEELYEKRKIEIFESGRTCFYKEGDSDHISEGPWPCIEEINLDPQFEAIEISQEAFDRIWDKKH